MQDIVGIGKEIVERLNGTGIYKGGEQHDEVITLASNLGAEYSNICRGGEDRADFVDLLRLLHKGYQSSKGVSLEAAATITVLALIEAGLVKKEIEIGREELEKHKTYLSKFYNECKDRLITSAEDYSTMNYLREMKVSPITREN